MAQTRAQFNGTSLVTTLSADYDVTTFEGIRVHTLDTNGATRNADLPPANDRRLVRKGGPGYIINVGAQNLTIRDNGGTSTGTVLAQDEAAICLLLDDSDADGSWRIIKKTVNSRVQARFTNLLYSIGGNGPGDEIFEYAHLDDAWTQKTDCPDVHIFSAGGRIGSGTSALIAGSTQSGSRDQANSYDPDVWTAETNVTGGDWETPSGIGITAAVYIAARQDAVTDQLSYASSTWTTETSLPNGSYEGSAETDGTDIYYYQGRPSTSAANEGGMQIYDVSGSTFSQGKEQMWPWTRGHGSGYLNSRFYKFCGEKEASDRSEQCQSYSVSDDAWREEPEHFPKSDLATAEQMGSAVLPDNNLAYLTAGLQDNGGFSVNHRSYDYTTQVWLQLEDLLDAKAGPTSIPIVQ